MARIVISTNASLDGVVQDPDGGEGFRAGGWFARAGDRALEAWAQTEAAEAERADALLLGRRTDAWFAERWLDRTGAWAERLNGLPKYVVSSDTPRWSNATLLRGDPRDAVAALKRELDGEIVVYASYRLCRALLAHDLVDELRLFVFPVLLGDGERLFATSATETALRLVEARTVGDGLAFLTYEL